MLFAELDRFANVAGLVRENQDGEFAAGNRHERFELEVALIVGGAAVAESHGVMAGAIEPVGEFVHLLFIFLFGVGE